MNQELNLILESHEKWLNGEDGGCRADLRGADLRGADLSGADLRGANLRGADLSGANLWSTTGNCREIKTIQTNFWQIVYTKDVMQIVCQRHSIDDWFNFDDIEISKMNSKALEFWKKWKPILALILDRQEVAK